MSKGFNYSKWDNIELSDDEDDVHPNIDRESWFRLKHRSRIEREEKEDKDKKKIDAEMAKTNLRIKEINKILSRASAANDDDSDSDDDLEDLDGLRSELKALKNANSDNQAKLDHYEKNKKWNVDNMCEVTEDRTIVNKNVAEQKFSESGFALPKEADAVQEEGDSKDEEKVVEKAKSSEKDDGVPTEKMSGAKIDDGAGEKTTMAKPTNVATTTAVTVGKTPKPPQLQPQPDDPTSSVSVSMLTYHEFTLKYADVVEQFMGIESMDKSKEFLLQNGDILLQENAANYLLLASLEDEMNGFHEKMKLVARQSQIISNIAELAKSLKLHPGNVIHPFFQRMTDKKLFEGFMVGVNEFIARIEVRAVTKAKEMDDERVREIREQGAGAEGTVDMSDIPREERLGPGGLDPLEVFETLPDSMQEAFESREKGQLEAALRAMAPDEMEYHMKRCIDSGLWNS
mmetsp:Transcript_12074/g.22496  ORF Transcript_12074/g.22496 Transcript_12074/m.22496 type:complete len:458 (-) Transcript_12074:253-1626(-)|eukprot:CAMPEP_0201872594 /NCGR_PEP_ID=MMETSP0902-20130614/5277_1 /ASSEMBLY_ACC=CAM_ASM_000551 /TAXON_ID=420261 /ORGANISM="Thalassiosira antarctica, Strain CCMP982" /LENGTH=457 /DNA_ID=CAMNT_0048398923 /DNA_START=70 /DNA_END=1443 /DNA_ORIENTATION=-